MGCNGKCPAFKHNCAVLRVENGHFERKALNGRLVSKPSLIQSLTWIEPIQATVYFLSGDIQGKISTFYLEMAQLWLAGSTVDNDISFIGWQ